MSALLPTATVVVRRFDKPVAMTWEAIMRDRIARGLEADPEVTRATPPRPPSRTKSPRAKKSSLARTFNLAGVEVDLRDPRNVAPCTAPAYTGPAPKTPAAAAKIRRELMAKCSCRLCALALNPPSTFAEHRALCGQILDESMEREVFGGPRVLREHVSSREAIAARREMDTAEQLIHGPGGVTAPWSTAERNDRGNGWEWCGNQWKRVVE